MLEEKYPCRCGDPEGSFVVCRPFKPIRGVKSENKGDFEMCLGCFMVLTRPLAGMSLRDMRPGTPEYRLTPALNASEKAEKRRELASQKQAIQDRQMSLFSPSWTASQ